MLPVRDNDDSGGNFEERVGRMNTFRLSQRGSWLNVVVYSRRQRLSPRSDASDSFEYCLIEREGRCTIHKHRVPSCHYS